jgi:hypothetical protein
MSSNQQVNTESADLRWKNLYRLGAIASITVLIVMLISVAGYIAWPNAAGVTPTVEIFNLIQTNVWAAFIALDLGLSISNLVSIFIYLALYVALRRVSETFALIALVLGLVAAAALIAARPVFEIFTLSDLYTAAGTETEKALYLAAGETLLVQFHGVAWYTYMFLGAVASLINALLMLRSQAFSRALAYVGIVTFSITLFFWVPVVGFMLLFVAMLGSAPYYILLARDLFRLTRKQSILETQLS